MFCSRSRLLFRRRLPSSEPLRCSLPVSARLAQKDIKRVLAYSTISQIGYMFLALGVGAWSAAMFHFMTHAFFKALLFLGAGVVILAQHEEHDMFKMGGLQETASDRVLDLPHRLGFALGASAS